jgi:Secretion system C-terminal sorting domain/GEVED domain/Domain of unknown function DUF11
MKSATIFLSRALGVVFIMLFMVASVHAQTVTGNGTTISDGDLAPSTTDGTDFGPKLVQLETGSSVFRFTNDSGLLINLIDITFLSSGTTTSTASPGDLELSYSATLPMAMPPGASIDMTLDFDPQDGGTHADQIEIDYNDGGPQVYNFAVSGDGYLDYGDDETTQSTLAENGARHVVTGIKLGSLRDSEPDASAFDDTANQPDEDGVIQPIQMFGGGQGSLVLDVSAAGFASAFVDEDDDATTLETVLFEDQAVIAGQNVITFTVPAGITTGGLRGRVRVCGTVDTCDTATGLADDGEVEDMRFAAFAAATVGTYTMVMTSLEAHVALSGANMVVTDENGNTLFSVPVANMDQLTITGDSSDESVFIDPDAIAPTNLGLITVNLGTGTDTMTITAGAAPATFVTHEFTNANDGDVWVDAAHIVYTGLDPIVDAVIAGHRTFTFSGATETITLTPDGDGPLGNGISHINSDAAEMVSFVNPTASLTINGGGGADTMVIGELDTPLDAGFATLTINSEGGDDVVTVTPSSSYTISADGGVGGTDLFDVDLSNGAVIDVFDTVGGTVSFTSGHNTINFSNFSAFGQSDLALTLSKSEIYAGDDLSGNTALVITVTNNGPAAAVDAAIDLGTLLTSNSSLSAAVSQGTLANTGAIAVGGTVTVTITGFVTDINPATHTVTVTYVGDPNTANNSATIISEPGFAFPAKTHLNAALYISRTSTIDGILSDPYDKLIVGLFQGSPGIDGAVWCKINNPIVSAAQGGGAGVVDDPADVLFPDPIPSTGFDTSYFGDRWRPCAKGLPFPLYVSDIFNDDNFTPGDPDDDTLWLATWGSAGLYKSVDGGESWTAAAPDATCTTIPTNCLANGAGGNSAWTLVYAITKDASGFLYISANDGYVFRSLNGGLTWQQVGSLPQVDADTPWSLVAHPTIGGTIYAGTFGRGVYVSEDFGFNWDFLGGDVENLVLLGNPAGDLDNPDDLFAGHIFDLEIAEDDGAPGSIFLFAGTGSGIWRYDVTSTPTAGALNEGWVFMGPTVTFDDASTAVPEIRSLALGADTDADGDPDFLLGGSWGFGAFSALDPTVPAAPTATQIALRGANVTFVAVGANGSAFVGLDTGETVTLDMTAASVSTATEDEFSPEVPSGYVLQQNYPNPFNPVTTIEFALPQTGKVRLAVYDVLGREVAVLVDGAMQAGTHGIQFDASGLTSGSYIYRLSTEKGSFTKQLSLLK